MISSDKLSFKFKKLYYFEKDTEFSVVPDDVEGMWRVRWPDGVLSQDYYNLVRAKDHCAKVFMELGNIAPESPVDAFK